MTHSWVVWERLFWEGVWPNLDRWDSVRLRTASTHWNVPGRGAPHGELFFFLTQKEPVVASNEVLPNPCLTAETLKECARKGLHEQEAKRGPVVLSLLI